MGLKRDDLEVFAQPSFLVALLTLVVNDLYLKTHYPNWLSGKLSDFAGLYIFAQFFAAVTGARIMRVAIVSGSLFVAWKSPAATPLIELVNSYSPLRVHRTIDYTDLAALAVLPLAVRLYTRKTNLRLSFLRYPVAVFAMLAIMATTIVPLSYNVRFDLQGLKNREVPIGAVYAEVDTLLIQRGMRCAFCAKGSSFRKYFDAQGNITAQFNYDSLDRKLFVSVHTYSPTVVTDEIQARLDEIQARLMELLRQRFENVTVVRAVSAYKNTEPRRSSWEIKVEAPSIGFPLSCSGNGINHPQIAKALAIFDEIVSLPTAVNLRTQRCYQTDARCSLDMCRHAVFGQVTGPTQFDRSIHAHSHGYVGWSGTSLYLEVTEYGHGRKAEMIADNLEKRLRNSLSGEITIAVKKPVAQPCTPGDTCRQARSRP